MESMYERGESIHERRRRMTSTSVIFSFTDTARVDCAAFVCGSEAMEASALRAEAHACDRARSVAVSWERECEAPG